MPAFSIKICMKNYVAPVLIALPLSCGNYYAYAANTGGKAYFPPAPENPGAQAAPLSAQPYKGICSNFLVRAGAKLRFARQMRNVPHEPRLSIKSFSNIEEVQSQFGPESYDISRHYCAATVTMNNGQSYPATYSVARGQGFAGIGPLHVSFCVVGFDNWLVRDNDCRSLRAPGRSIY